MPISPKKNSSELPPSERSTVSHQVISPRAMQRVARLSKITSSYLILMGISGVLAAIAMLTDSIPILIGSMIIAPALPPLALISFAIVNRRPKLVQEGFVSVFVGLSLAILASLLTTWLFNTTHVIPKEVNLLNKALLDERVTIGWYSPVTAIAAGIAGMIALTERKTDTLVGVVAALALVPAGAAGAIAFISEDPIRGLGGIALLGLNAILIIISGVITLLVLRPNVQG